MMISERDENKVLCKATHIKLTKSLEICEEKGDSIFWELQVEKVK